MARHNKTGRSKTASRFVMLEEYLLRSDAWQEASPNARAALIELLRRYNGTNNGSIRMGVRELGPLLGRSHHYAARALLELEELGFIECKSLGGFAMRNRKASEYLLTMHRCDLTGNRPVKTFMQHIPARSLSHQCDNTVSPVRHTKDNCSLRYHQCDNGKSKPQQIDTSHCLTHATHLNINHTPTEQTSAQVETDPFADLELPVILDRRGELARRTA